MDHNKCDEVSRTLQRMMKNGSYDVVRRQIHETCQGPHQEIQVHGVDAAHPIQCSHILHHQ